MCVSCRSRYNINTLSNIRIPVAPKHLQEIFWLVSCVRSFHEQQKQMKSEMKGLILLIRLIFYILSKIDTITI